MGHGLYPKDKPLTANEIADRLRATFSKVIVDREGGRQSATATLAQFERWKGMPTPPMPAEQLLQSMALWTEATKNALQITVVDDDGTRVEFLAADGIPPIVGYSSQTEERRARPILERCAESLGYELVII
jgi:hypothetical protein